MMSRRVSVYAIVAMFTLLAWLRQDGSTWGRPVDILTGPDGSLLISDDGQGFIYRVFFEGERPA
jgi:glucose/arabinose dehydrogenase